jgi:hypothetical protein
MSIFSLSRLHRDLDEELFNNTFPISLLNPPSISRNYLYYPGIPISYAFDRIINNNDEFSLKSPNNFYSQFVFDVSNGSIFTFSLDWKNIFSMIEPLKSFLLFYLYFIYLFVYS